MTGHNGSRSRREERLGRIVDWLAVYCAGRWVAAGYVSDVQSGVRALQQFDPRHGGTFSLRGILRLRRPANVTAGQHADDDPARSLREDRVDP